ncbi:kinase-like domain-containing protein [Cyathus striatus]|nr:kinase-like domain-containing protein [Cyathus striatus]
MPTTSQPLHSATASQGSNVPEPEGTQLYGREVFWRDHQTWLKSAGYILRPRYRPDWAPSWLADPSKMQLTSEDNLNPLEGSLIDAVRERDGLQVMLKRVHVQKHPTEIKIAALFSTEPLASDPRNHCVQVYDILQLPEEDNSVILVMPFLLKLDRPPFVSLAEILELIRQLLEGLHFMHQQNIAHCDVKRDNMMSDTLQLFRIRPHPLTMGETFTRTGKPKLASTRLQKSVKHYFVDFGLSQLHPTGSSRLQYPGYGGKWLSVPEFQKNSTEPCDPFAVDVYCMGDFMRTRFRMVCTYTCSSILGLIILLQGESHTAAFRGLEFLDNLIADMVQDDPKKRPTMDQVVERFSRIVEDLSTWKLMSRASTVEETQSERIVKNVRYWIGLS